MTNETNKQSYLTPFQPLNELAAWDAVVQEVPELKVDAPELVLEVVELVREAMVSGHPLALAASHVFERKGYVSQDPLGGTRNRSYGSDSDDVLLQVTVRVPQREVTAVIRALAEERAIREDEALNVRKNELDARIAELQAERDKL